tara:strand:+ start:1382 stop:2689 length:1308 start_codon:yes stop_codon:yes gene_type:complete
MSELEQTIEELEAEVLAELEEADDPTKKGAAPAAKAEKVKGKTPGGEVEDLGGDTADEADPQAKLNTGVKVSAKAKEASGDPAQKGEGSPDKAEKVAGTSDEKKLRPGAGKNAGPKKLAAGDETDHAGDELKENKRVTKAQHLESIARMKKADIEEMIAVHTAKLEETENAETEEALQKLEDAKAEIEDKIKNISVKEDVEALINADDTLSEEFKVKAATIFEAAVKSRVRSEIERIDDELNTEKETEIAAIKEEVSEKVDTYLNYVVEEWTKENELAIERGLKGEIAEDFISGLKQLFEDHYIDVPDEKYDVLEAQSEKISELEERLNEEMQKNIDLSTDKSELVREQVISEVSEDLADTEIEKFKSLTEDLVFTDEESFREKLDTLKDNYFPKTVVDQSFDDEDGSTAQDTVDTTDAMKTYMSAISRNHKASA